MKLLAPLVPVLVLTPALLPAAPGDFKWSFPTDGVVYSSPALDAAGNLYVGSEDGNLYALSATGSVRWVSGVATDWIDSSPALAEDGTVHFGSWDGSLYALNGATGALRWSYQTGGVVIASPAVGSDGAVYCGSYDGAFYTLNPDGSLRWLTVTEGEIESSAALDAEGNVYFGNNAGIFYSVDGQGQTRWQLDFGLFEPLATTVAIQSSPALAADGTILVGARFAWTGGTGIEFRSGLLAALDPDDGTPRWTFVIDDYLDASPAVAADGSIYFAARDGYLYKLDVHGLLEWELLVGDVFYGSPAIGASGTVYLGSYVGEGFSAINAVSAEGSVLWTYLFDGYNDSSPNLSPDGSLYFGSHNFALMALETGEGLSTSAPWRRFRGDAPQTGSRQESFVYADPAVITFFPSAEAAGDDWYWIDWMGSGWFYGRHFRWISHFDHGWLFCQNGTGDAGWFFDVRLGWLYSSRGTANFFYHPPSLSWIYHAPGTTVDDGGRYFYVFRAMTWMHEEILANWVP